MILSDEAAKIVATYKAAKAAQARAVAAWRRHRDTVADVYYGGQGRGERITEEDIGNLPALQVTRQQVSRWIRQARTRPTL